MDLAGGPTAEPVGAAAGNPPGASDPISAAAAAQFGIGYLALNLLLLPMAAYITWFFNRSRSSLLLPVAFHLAFNLVNVVWLPVTSSIGAFGIFIALLWAVTLPILRHLAPGPVEPAGTA